MILTLKRKRGTKGFTHGTLSIDGVFFCDTLEDEERALKVYGATAIPCGHYKVVLNMSARFKRLMPQILNVPNFEGVRIHNGNTDKDTDGCVLVGKYLQQGFITKSKDTFRELMAVLIEAYGSNKVITIEVI